MSKAVDIDLKSDGHIDFAWWYAQRVGWDGCRIEGRMSQQARSVDWYTYDCRFFF